jgi:uncharacterized protein
MSVSAAIPDWGMLVREVARRCTNHGSHMHGPAHWKCVALTGCMLMKDSGAGDPAVVLLFGLLHDSMRIHDGGDRDHGRRAGAFALELNGQLFHLDKAQIDLLQRACNDHNFGKLSKDPTIAACWDADRLNLWRLGMRPDERFLSTDAAKQKKRIDWARDVVEQSFTWSEIYGAFEVFGSAQKQA